MNLVLIDENYFIGDNLIEIKNRQYTHIKDVLKLKVGDNFIVGKKNGLIGEGEIITFDPDKIQAKIELKGKPPTKLPLTLIIALPRPKTLRKVIHSAITLGVKEIYFIESWKVTKSYWQSPMLEKEYIDNEIILALEQAKDTIPPEIYFKKRFKPFMEDELAEIAKDKKMIIAHPLSENKCPYNLKEDAILAIGPEGGFTEYEVNKFIEIGFEPVNIGERILRVEYAVPNIIGKLF